jgi:hypothetical protein
MAALPATVDPGTSVKLTVETATETVKDSAIAPRSATALELELRLAANPEA